jgi:hypothetical protein
MNATFDRPFALDDDKVTDADLAGYYSPKNIVDDIEITASRKRALLAHWASDIHAVPGMPALRHGWKVTTSIDAIMAAMTQLDEMVDPAAIPVKAGAGSVTV